MTNSEGTPPGPHGEGVSGATQDVLDRFDAVRGTLHPDRLETLLTRQAEAAVEVLSADAAGISMLLLDRMRVPLAASSEMARLAESLQFTLGEGPCLDAFGAGRPILVPDLTDRTSHAWQAWPAYAEELVERTSFRAVYAIPLTARGLSLGTLSLYRERPGELTALKLGDALAVAHHIFFDLVDTGTFSGEVQPEFQWANLPMARVRTVVWQAVGMVVIQMGFTTADALSLLRSYCFGHDRFLDEIAADIVDGRLELDKLHP